MSPRPNPVFILALSAVTALACNEPELGPQAGSPEPDESSDSAALSAPLPTCPKAFDSDIPEDAEFEYVVVGSGAGGGTVAARLAEEGHSVLVLEAGDCVYNPTYSIPALHANATENEDLAGHYFVKHYDDPPGLDTNNRPRRRSPQRILYPRGLALGGSTAVNAMITVLPHQNDWKDTFGQVNAAQFQNKYYNRVMSWLSVELPSARILFGNGASLFGKVDEVDFKLLKGVIAAVLTFGNRDNFVSDISITDAFRDIEQFDNVLTDNINEEKLEEPDLEGTYQFPIATKNRARNGTRERLIAAFNRTNNDNNPNSRLVIRTNALVTKVIFEEGTNKAVGVEYLVGKKLHRAHLGDKRDASKLAPRQVQASREVILSAGAYNTPQLLMLSGIGPKEQLDAFGIDPVLENESVGTNLQDRYEVGIVHELEKIKGFTFNRFKLAAKLFKETVFRVLRPCDFTGDDDDECATRWAEKRKGVYTANGSIISVLMKSKQQFDLGAAGRPDLHLFGVPGDFRGYHVNYSKEAVADKKTFTWLILKGYNKNNAGTVKLRTKNAWDSPDINFHSFHEGNDEAMEDMPPMIEAVRSVRRIVRKHNDKLEGVSFRLKEQWPSDDVQSDEQIAHWVAKEAWGHHACCTVPVGDVLNEDLTVKDIEGLRVVDASAFNKIPGTFLVLPTYMLGEYGADKILEDAE